MWESSSVAHRGSQAGPPGYRKARGAVEERGEACIAFIGPKGPVAVVDVARAGSAGRRLAVRECRRRACIDSVVLGARADRSACPSAHGRASNGELPGTLVQAVRCGEADARVFVVNSSALMARERAARRRSIERTRAALDDLARRVADRGLQGTAEVGRAAARILARNDGYRYFDWRRKGGAFLYFERLEREGERAVEGAYVIRAEEPGPGPDLRVHVAAERARAATRAFVAALAFLLDRAFERLRPGVLLATVAAVALEELDRTDIVDLSGGAIRIERRRLALAGSV